MNRKDFIRNTLMAFAINLVPKILQPCIPQVPKLIVGWFVIAKEMLNDLPFLEIYVPKMLIKEMSKNDGFDYSKEITIEMSEHNENNLVNNEVTIIGTQII